MPHVNIQYSANLGAEAAMDALCFNLAEVLVAQRDGNGARVFPIGGTRVFAYPAPHFAVADGQGDRAFVYLQVRIAPGRERALVTAAGEAMMSVVRSHFAALFASRPIGITLQIDEGAPVFDAKHRAPCTRCSRADSASMKLPVNAFKAALSRARSADRSVARSRRCLRRRVARDDRFRLAADRWRARTQRRAQRAGAAAGDRAVSGQRCRPSGPKAIPRSSSSASTSAP